MAQLKFYKSASAPAAAATGAIWFDTTNHTIQVKTNTGWDKYAGALNDVTWDDTTLTITKHDGKPIVLDFSDFASASGVTAALAGKLAIGTNVDAAGTQSYHGLKKDIATAQDAAIAVDSRLTNTIGTLDNTDAKTLKAINDELNAVDKEIGNIKNAIAGGVHFRGIISASDGETLADNLPDPSNYNVGDIIMLVWDSDGTHQEPSKEYILIYSGDANAEKMWMELGDISPADQRLTAIEESYVKSVATTDGTYVKLTPDAKANNAVVVAVDDQAIADKFAEIERFIEGAVAGSVASIGGQAGTITLLGGQTDNGFVNLTMNGKQLGAAVVGLKSAAFTDAADYATAAQGVKADTAEDTAKAYADSLLDWALFE